MIRFMSVPLPPFPPATFLTDARGQRTPPSCALPAVTARDRNIRVTLDKSPRDRYRHSIR